MRQGPVRIQLDMPARTYWVERYTTGYGGGEEGGLHLPPPGSNYASDKQGKRPPNLSRPGGAVWWSYRTTDLTLYATDAAGRAADCVARLDEKRTRAVEEPELITSHCMAHRRTVCRRSGRRPASRPKEILNAITMVYERPNRPGKGASHATGREVCPYPRGPKVHNEAESGQRGGLGTSAAKITTDEGQRHGQAEAKKKKRQTGRAMPVSLGRAVSEVARGEEGGLKGPEEGSNHNPRSHRRHVWLAVRVRVVIRGNADDVAGVPPVGGNAM